MTKPSHPLLSGRYLIPTTPLTNFHELVQKWIAKNISGGYIWGLPRVGKTWMAGALDGSLYTRDGSPIRSRFTMAATLLQTDRKFWGWFLTAWNITYKSRATSAELLATVIALLKESAFENGERTVVLAIDEAQKLQRIHFSLLLDLTNLLENVGVRIIVISVGSIELPKLVRQFHRRKSDAQYRSRFFAAELEVHGLRGVEEVRQALAWYDFRQAPTAPCFTEHFRPQSYREGFRLANLAHQMWKEYLKQFPDGRSSGWGMKYFQTSVLLLLSDLLAEEQAVSEELIALAIKNCGESLPLDPKKFDLEDDYILS